ncbi:MAG: response regulator [bacterium]|nr:response regulator [bacterium]
MKVLIVDDDPDVRSFLVSCVETMKCDQIDTAENGEEALARAVQTRYDLVTLDLKMPGVSGLDILSVIRGMMPWAVIVIVSGYTEDLPEMAMDYTDLVLSKPVRVGALQ